MLDDGRKKFIIIETFLKNRPAQLQLLPVFFIKILSSNTLITFQTEKSTKKQMVKKLYQPYKPNLDFSGLDQIIIGSGMGGLTVATWLAKAGKKVAIFER